MLEPNQGISSLTLKRTIQTTLQLLKIYGMLFGRYVRSENRAEIRLKLSSTNSRQKDRFPGQFSTRKNLIDYSLCSLLIHVQLST
jgi:hypothetical protein